MVLAWKSVLCTPILGEGQLEAQVPWHLQADSTEDPRRWPWQDWGAFPMPELMMIMGPEGRDPSSV